MLITPVEDALAAYFGELEGQGVAQPHALAIDVAGPVTDGEASLTNAHWKFSSRGLAARFDLHDGERVRVTSRHGAVEMPLRLDSRVKAGENSGEFLQHDFVVRQYTPAGDYRTDADKPQTLLFRSIAPTPGHARQVNLVVIDAAYHEYVTDPAHADAAVTFLLIADNPPVDYWHYPDSNKWGLRAPRQFFRVDPLDYWDGEE